MSENKMSEVAKLLNVKIGEEFWLSDSKNGYERIRCKYKITSGGLERKYYYEGAAWGSSALLEDIITGRYEVVKINPISVLDAAEKKYISRVIKPFKDYVIAIAKRSANYGEFIDIMIDEGEIGDCGNIYLPYFKPGKMYQGMKVNREYTLEQLDL